MLEYDKSLSTFAFKFNLRRCSKVTKTPLVRRNYPEPEAETVVGHWSRLEIDDLKMNRRGSPTDASIQGRLWRSLPAKSSTRKSPLS
jgi:hypothetical protein